MIGAKECPLLVDYLNESSKRRFDAVCALLRARGIEFNMNPRMVRGLDYYTHTIFEYVAYNHAQLGSQQATILAGGTYDHLVSLLSGPNIPGFGCVPLFALLLPTFVVVF